jgi:hypothetical protein
VSRKGLLNPVHNLGGKQLRIPSASKLILADVMVAINFDPIARGYITSLAWLGEAANLLVRPPTGRCINIEGNIPHEWFEGEGADVGIHKIAGLADAD